MFRTFIAIVTIFVAIFVVGLAVQKPTAKTHRLEATPATVAFGYYWSEAKPALRIASGDIIDVDTLLTNNPNGLQNAGLGIIKVLNVKDGTNRRMMLAQCY
ncbi:MAG: hypothetical protein ACRD82_04745, partial [Blastocatellia bacterium]